MTSLRRSLIAVLLLLAGCAGIEPRATGDMGVVVERASGSLLIVEHSKGTVLGRVEGLGDLSHASAVFGRDERHVYVFGRDGGLTKVDILAGRIAKRVMQAGNSIGGAISQDGRLIAAANYTPGGVKVLDAETLDVLSEIPAAYGDKGALSKVVGLEDSTAQRFVFSLYDGGEIWVADLKDPKRPQVRKFPNIGKQPYDGLISEDGRHYIAGLFGEDGMALLDLWNLDAGVKRILPGYGKGQEPLPVYKMPHLEGWAVAGDLVFLPAVGRHEVLVVSRSDWREVARIPVHGQPVFAEARPDGRQVWVNFALPHNDTVQVIDVASLKVAKTIVPGKGVLHMEFTPRGERIWLSVRDEDKVKVYDTETVTQVGELPAQKPSGIFFTARAHRIGL